MLRMLLVLHVPREHAPSLRNEGSRRSSASRRERGARARLPSELNDNMHLCIDLYV